MTDMSLCQLGDERQQYEVARGHGPCNSGGIYANGQGVVGISSSSVLGINAVAAVLSALGFGRF
jgi:hypothetical protein